MEKLIDAILGGFAQFGVRDAIDILIIAFLVYNLINITRETRAAQVLKGLGSILLLSWICTQLELQATAWMLDQVLRAGALMILIIFQPELRRALEQIGRGKIFERSGLFSKIEMDREKVIGEITIALSNLSVRKVGALIIFERATGLADIISTGTRIQAIISAALIENIFEPNTPLHDGAMILREGIVIGAGCFLPLSEDPSISRSLGTRHRAALGMSEVSDCVSIVVSEETGAISYAQQGKLYHDIKPDELKQVLRSVYVENAKSKRFSFFNRKGAS